MIALILRTSIKLIVPLMIAYSIYMLLRGHNEPGGGFIGGLVLSLAFILKEIARKASEMSEVNTFVLTRRYANTVVGCVGCLLFLILLPLVFGKGIFEGLWTSIPIPVAGKLSSVLIFDVVIYVIVASSVVFAYHLLNDNEKGEANR